MNEPLISIIIPVYNTEKYLDKCLKSITEQTYKNIEIIVIDDGSTDSSYDILVKWAEKDNRIKVLRQENSGQGVARNKALDHCLPYSDYVTFVDSDDYVLPDMLSKMYLCAKKYDADIVICATSFDNGIKVIPDKNDYSEETVFTAEEILASYFSSGKVKTAPWAKLFKKSCFLEVRFPDVRIYEDYYIMHRLFGAAKKTVHCGKNFYIQYVRHGSTTTSNFSLKSLVILDCDLEIQKYVKEKFPNLYPLVARNYADALRNVLISILRSHVKRKYHDVYNDCLDKLKKEIIRLQEEGGHDLSTHLFAINHSGLFALKYRMYGTKVAIKRKIRRVFEKKEK